MAAASDAVSATTATETETGLPAWLDDLLKPGVGKGGFMTLKACLVGLVLVLIMLLMTLQDEVSFHTRRTACSQYSPQRVPSQTVRMHVGIFLTMTVVLLCLVMW
jgi:hypothetical protein